MSITRTVLLKSLVKTFYRQNAGLLTFFLFMLLGAVGSANEAGLLEYHYALIRGMLINPGFLILVLLLWFLYAMKCKQFISQTLRTRGYSFLHTLSFMKTGKVFRLLLLVEALIYLPVLWYVLVIAGVGIHLHQYAQVVVVILFNLIVCLLSARWFLYLLHNPGTNRFAIRWKIPVLIRRKFYWTFFTRYLLNHRKALLLVIKLYNCGILYLMVSRQLGEVYDLSMILLFYCFGMLGHGVIIHQFRDLEESRLSFYRGLPVSLAGRFIQYGCLYFILFIPEIITISRLTPAYLRPADALLFGFLGYGLLLLLNSLLFIKPFGKKQYLKIVVVIFFILFAGIVTGTMIWLTMLSFLFSVYLFFSRYYRYESV